MNTPTLSQLAGIVAKAAFDARTAIGPISHDPRSSLWDKVDRVNEAIAKAVLDAVGYEFPVDPEREAFDAWVTANPSRSSNDDLFEAWNAGRAYALDNQPERRDALYKEMRERFKAEEQKDMQALENARAAKPAPETFEAHGLTWFKHTPGDPMPCDGTDCVTVLLYGGIAGMEEGATGAAKGRHWGLDTPLRSRIVGWRYATADAP